MIDRQRIVTTGITAAAAATVALVLWLEPWTRGSLVAPEPDVRPSIVQVEAKTRQIDLVFALDTTGSMGGLLDGAKRTVWSIANQVREIEKNADLRIGLVAYKDLGDEYVTKSFQLDDDLDAVFAELSSYQASGGGDVPENVDAALHDAVHKMSWRAGAKKVIFLVGDAPPSSRGDVPAFDVTARVAASRQIKINTIRCGLDSATARAWQQVAAIGGGHFSSIQQDGGVQQIATPYDDRMAALAAEVDSTTVYYGDHAARRGYEGKMAVAAAAPAAARADRGAYYAKGGGGAARPAEDAVAGLATGAMDVGDLEEAKLPEQLRGKSKEALKLELEARARKRQAAQKEIAELAKKRDEYIRANTKDSNGFDSVVKKTLEDQLE